MTKNKRNLTLDIFDYAGNQLATIYDSSCDILGQACNVVISTNRNGWKELSFSMPDSVQDTSTNEQLVGYARVDVRKKKTSQWTENEKAKYLKADYKIRAIDDDGVDWFIISEPRISHNGLTKMMSVTAGHVSQTLKTKNLGLEFSDEEGNNIGTAEELLTTILEGTGWEVGSVDTFYEKDGETEKKRSLKASAKTGAFNLISKMCALFDAKPIYHGDEKTVDIKPLNPFSEPKDGELPEVAYDDVVELHYGKNVRNVTRTSNTENLVTKLYAYGSYGDDVTGYCGIDECTHKVWTFESKELSQNVEYHFTVDDGTASLTYYFIPTINTDAGNLTYSALDPASKMYIYDTENEIAWFVNRKPTQEEWALENENELTAYDPTDKPNAFSFIMAFDYYREAGLLTDEMLQAIAKYQNGAPDKVIASTEASAEFADGLIELSELIGTVDFCKLDIASFGKSEGQTTVTLDKSEHEDGVAQTTQYDIRKEKRFKWRVTEALNDKGMPTMTGTSVVYIVHATTPVTWEKVWIKAIDDEDKPSVLTLWTTINGNALTDRVYLFSSNNVNGQLGAYESAQESTIDSLESATKVITDKHPVHFQKTQPGTSGLTLYQWWYKIDDIAPSQMYFIWPEENDHEWKRVYLTNTEPTYHAGDYWFDWKRSMLHRGINGAWSELTSQTEKRVATVFSTVWYSCLTYDKYNKGQQDYYRYAVDDNLPIGSYAFDGGYGSYWLFSTEKNMTSGDTLEYSTTDKWINAVTDGIEDTYESKSYRFNSLDYHSANVQTGANLVSGSLNVSDGTEIANAEGATNQRSSSIRVYPNVTYSVYVTGAASNPLTVCFYNEKSYFIPNSGITVTSSRTFTTPENTRYMRVSAERIESLNLDIHAENYSSSIIADNKTYRVLPTETTGEPNQLKSIPEFIKRFADAADDLYGNKRVIVDAAQSEIKELENEMQNALGDLYREGWWQKDDYVDGDEEKLYDDALDNLNEISKPDVQYSIGQIDLYGQEGSENDVLWPDVSSTMAAHLIDPELGINTWAYIDNVQKCYDKPWETKITINTNMTLMNQHTFTDVMSHIAEVASELNAKQSRYDKAVIKNDAGRISAETLQGRIDADTLKITGGSSTWQTDEKGNMIFVSANGESAMTLTGNGFAIANSKNTFGEWNWRSFGTGDGFTADEIVTGFLRAGAVTILGSEQFYWDANNIYIFDPSNENNQIRIGQYDGVHYGIGFTNDNGATWQNAIGFDGVHFSFGGQSDITEALNSKASKEELNTTRAALEVSIAGIQASVERVSSDEFIENLSQSVLEVTEGKISSKVTEIVTETTQTKEEVEERIGYRVEIIATSDILSDAIKTTTLTAHVQNGNQDVTASFAGAPTRFSWKRVSSDSSGDITWNNDHQRFGNVLTLSTSDVYYSASYSCEFS